jgi:hypothetical protein
MVVAGFFVSIQGPINARLSVAVDSPVLNRRLLSAGRSGSLVCHGERYFSSDSKAFRDSPHNAPGRDIVH